MVGVIMLQNGQKTHKSTQDYLFATFKSYKVKWQLCKQQTQI